MVTFFIHVHVGSVESFVVNPKVRVLNIDCAFHDAAGRRAWTNVCTTTAREYVSKKREGTYRYPTACRANGGTLVSHG